MVSDMDWNRCPLSSESASRLHTARIGQDCDRVPPTLGWLGTPAALGFATRTDALNSAESDPPSTSEHPARRGLKTDRRRIFQRFVRADPISPLHRLRFWRGRRLELASHQGSRIKEESPPRLVPVHGVGLLAIAVDGTLSTKNGSP
jgi:hypothetical protein